MTGGMANRPSKLQVSGRNKLTTSMGGRLLDQQPQCLNTTPLTPRE